MFAYLTKLWGRAWSLMRDPCVYVPNHQLLDRWRHEGGVVPLRPSNRPFWPAKPFHNEPLIRAFRVYRMMGKDWIWWEDLLALYERLKREQYG